MISKTKLHELMHYRQAKHCVSDNVFIVEGVKMAQETINARADIHCVCATKEWCEEHGSSVDCPIYEVSEEQLGRLSLMRSPNQVWMLVGRDVPYMEQTSRLTLVLDHLQDPGNIGTIMRTCDWYGIRRIVCSEDSVDCFNPKVVQASMGAVFRTKVEYVDLPEWLGECGKKVYGAMLDGSEVKEAKEEEAVLVIGNESKGISKQVAQRLDQRLTIPNIGGTAESLNAAVATAILIDKILTR